MAWTHALRWHVLCQIHAVMQEPKNVDHLAILGGADSEHNEMSPLATVPRDMERPDFATNFWSFLDPNDGWAGA